MFYKFYFVNSWVVENGTERVPFFQTYNADVKKSPSFSNSDVMKMLVSRKVDEILI